MMKKEALKTGILNALHGVDPKTATPQQLHQALGETVMEAIAPDWKRAWTLTNTAAVPAISLWNFWWDVPFTTTCWCWT